MEADLSTWDMEATWNLGRLGVQGIKSLQETFPELFKTHPKTHAEALLCCTWIVTQLSLPTKPSHETKRHSTRIKPCRHPKLLLKCSLSSTPNLKAAHLQHPQTKLMSRSSQCKRRRPHESKSDAKLKSWAPVLSAEMSCRPPGRQEPNQLNVTQRSLTKRGPLSNSNGAPPTRFNSF